MIKHPAKTYLSWLWKKTVLVFFSFIICGVFNLSFTQSTNINGVVNSYYKVIEIIPAKACVRVSDPTGLDVNTRVLLVQMKGATINTSTGSSFGDISSMNNAGNYEIGTICYLIGDSVFLFHELVNNYDTAGKVQLVQFAEYYTAVVADTVKAASWDSTAGTGGVVAIFCDQDLTLNAPIYADSSGYRGGKVVVSDGTCFNSPLHASLYAYNPTSTTPQNGAYKGESVARLTTSISGGRGSPANGGGGGNNHNNSGGGGANLTTGGTGGGNSSTGGCLETLRGVAGKALSSSGGQKIYLGGGGGAGHTNFINAATKGGNGGGIIFIWALNLNGNNQTISASGGTGGASLSDGAGGGGAGGTIIMHVTNYIGNVTVKSEGGSGGDSNDNFVGGRCYGGGGGGSGGVIYFTGSVPAITTSVAGGAAGSEINSSGCGTQPGFPGAAGQTISSYSYTTSTDPAAYCELLLPVQLEYFKVALRNRDVLLQWKILNPGDIEVMVIERSTNGQQWSDWKFLDAEAQRMVYNETDDRPFTSRTYYRIRFVERNQSTSYSPVRLVNLNIIQDFVIFPNPSRERIKIITNYRSPVECKFYDLSGKLILKKTLQHSSGTISVASLTAGVYIIEVNGNKQKLLIH